MDSHATPPPQVNGAITTKGPTMMSFDGKKAKGPRFHDLTDDQREALLKLKRALELFRAIEPRMPSSYVDAYLSVALEPGKGPTEYAKDMQTIQPIASRVLLEIGSKAREREEGLGLVDRQANPETLRSHEYFLTQKGKRLLHGLFKVFGADE